MDKVLLGKRLREARKSKGYTQTYLANKADVGIVYLSEIERGLKMPSLNIFIKIIETLDISADFVLRDELSSGMCFVMNDINNKLKNLTPKQRKCAIDILDAYISNL